MTRYVQALNSAILKGFPTTDGRHIKTHNTASQTLLDVIAVSYQAMGPQEALLPQGIGASLMGEQAFPQAAGGNLLVDELKRFLSHYRV